MELTAFNASLRKLNTELSAQLAALKLKNEELATNYARLVEKNAKVISQMDGVKDELAKEKAENASLNSELEMATLKVQTIAMDVVLRARAELVKEFKRSEQTSWDPDEEIWTWKRREAVLAGGGDESKEDDDESTPMAGSPKRIKLGDKQAEPKAGIGDVPGDVGKQGYVEPVASQTDITKD